MRVGRHGEHHQTGDQRHRHQGHSDCCDLCMVACARCTVVAGGLSSVKLGATVHYAPRTTTRSTPIAWSPRPRLPLSIGPPLLRV
jgi:hypothetical protein